MTQRRFLSTARSFEMFANRAIYNDGWVAATTPPTMPWVMGETPDVNDYKWELYNVENDFSEANDLAAKKPKKLRELQDPFWVEAFKYNVLALDSSRIERNLMCESSSAPDAWPHRVYLLSGHGAAVVSTALVYTFCKASRSSTTTS